MGDQARNRGEIRLETEGRGDKAHVKGVHFGPHSKTELLVVGLLEHSVVPSLILGREREREREGGIGGRGRGRKRS